MTRFHFDVPVLHPNYCKECDINPCQRFKESDLKRDEDGDLVVERLPNHDVEKDVITIGKEVFFLLLNLFSLAV